MIKFDHLPLDKDILEALEELHVNYVFQPIFEADGETVFAYEALMRPEEKSVLELIKEYTDLDKLHVLEVASFFGSMQEYFARGYEERVSINSFPSDCLEADEAEAFCACFDKDVHGKMIIESLEYPYFSAEHWEKKRQSVKSTDNLLSVDDFGSGINDLDRVDLLSPHMVKLDRSLISGIDHITEKQENVKDLVSRFHDRGIRVVAEGVEEKDEFDCLVDLGIDLFQGYYLARPA